MTWHIAREGRKLGPFDRSQLAEMAAGGELNPSDMVLPQSGEIWYPVPRSTGSAFGEVGTIEFGRHPSSELRIGWRRRHQQGVVALRDLSSWHYRLNGCIAGQLLIGIVAFAIVLNVDAPILMRMTMLAAVVVLGTATLVAMFHLAKCLELNPWAITLVAVFGFPFVWLFLDLRALGQILKQAGFKSGVLGRRYRFGGRRISWAAPCNQSRYRG